MRVYLVCAMVGIVAGAYWCGGRIAREKCNAITTHNQMENILKIENIKRTANEKVIHTDNIDIRRVMHERYSVAE